MSDTISCPQCSSPLPAGAVFCTNCGHRLEEHAAPAAAATPPAPATPPATEAPPAPAAPPEDATRVDTPGLNDATQAFAVPPAAPQEDSGPASQPGGGYGAAPGAPWQPADAGASGPASWNPPPQAPQGQQPPQQWQQPQPGAPQQGAQQPGAPHPGAPQQGAQQPGAPHPGAPQQGGAPQGWGAPDQGAPGTWDTTGTAPATSTRSTSLLGGLVALVGGALTLAGIFTAWFKLSTPGGSNNITGWALTSGDEVLESKDPYILLALGIVALVVGVLLFIGQKRIIVRIAAVLVGIAIIGLTINDWMTAASLVEDKFESTTKLAGAIGFYLTIAGGVVTAVAALLPAKK